MIQVPARPGRQPEVMTEASTESAGAEAAAGIEEPAPREHDWTQSSDWRTNGSTTVEDEDVAAGSPEALEVHRGCVVVRFRAA
jgi:hypothetical protein